MTSILIPQKQHYNMQNKSNNSVLKRNIYEKQTHTPHHILYIITIFIDVFYFISFPHHSLSFSLSHTHKHIRSLSCL